MTMFRTASACLLMALGAERAAADTVWTLWERDGARVGEIYLAQQTKTHQVYQIDALQIRFYVEFKPYEASPGTISSGYYVNYDPTATPCNEGPARDHVGANVAAWGYLEHAHDPAGSDDFYLRTGVCGDVINRDFIARW